MPRNYLVSSYPNRGVSFSHGEGAYLITEDGMKYLDMGSNYGVSVFGYQHPRIIPALAGQLQSLPNLHGSFNSRVRTDAAQMLIERCGGVSSRVFFCNSGTEAIEAALKFTRLATGKSHIVSFEHGYHGKTLGALSATDGEKYRAPFLPLAWNFSFAKYGDADSVRAHMTDDTAAVILEPVQGEGGIRTAPPEFFTTLQRLCAERGVLLIVDEIQTGMGRTGTFLASQAYGLTPDIICLGKGLAGGIPIGAAVVSEPVAEKVPVHIHTSTFGGNPLACAGIIAALGELSDGAIFAHVRESGDYFLEQLRIIHHPLFLEARGKGFMIGMEFKENVTPILKALQERRIIAIPAGPNIVRFLPPFIVGKIEIDMTVAVLKEIFSLAKT